MPHSLRGSWHGKTNTYHNIYRLIRPGEIFFVMNFQHFSKKKKGKKKKFCHKFPVSLKKITQK
jgi:hypothetical protein